MKKHTLVVDAGVLVVAARKVAVFTVNGLDHTADLVGTTAGFAPSRITGEAPVTGASLATAATLPLTCSQHDI